MNSKYLNEGTGIPPKGSFGYSPRPVTEKDKVDLWFCDQLLRMQGHDAFVCMMLLFPLIETIIRFELKIPDDQDVVFSDNSPALNWFSEFMTIPDDRAREVWDSFRNGLMHRSMVKGLFLYELTGKKTGRCAEIVDGRLIVYVWEMRNAVVGKLRQHHKHLWQGESKFPVIFIEG
jgi:hypothetical protein